MASSAAGFVEGLQGGMKFRADSKRNKKIDRLLDQKGELGAMELWGQQDQMGRAAEMEGYDLPDFGVSDDPYDFSLKSMFGGLANKVKSAFGGKAEQAIPELSGRPKPSVSGVTGPDPTAPDPYGGAPKYDPGAANPTTSFAADGGAIRRYANGGAVQPRRAGYYQDPETGVEFVDGVPQGEVPTQGYSGRGALSVPQKIRGFAEDIGRNVGGNTRRRMAEWAPDGMDTSRAIVDAPNATARGHAIRRDMAEGARGVGQLGLGLLEDTSVLPIIKGIGGVLGFGDDPADAPREADVTDVPGVPSDQQSAIDAADMGPPAPDKVASQPDKTRTTAAPAAPQAVDTEQPQNIEYANAPIVNPADMPTMTTKDWVAYRASSVTNMIARGATPDEAHEAITSMQHRGFMNHGLQALSLLASGDAPRATMALKAAYQYFPNGVDVKFGMTKDKAGQPALIAMGQLEGSDGEGTGKPMLLTQERLAALIHNMKDPSAFTAWTKDWRDEQFNRQKHRDTTAINTANAETARMNARANLNRSDASIIDAMRSGTADMKRTDIDRNLFKFMEVAKDAGFMEEINGEEVTPDMQRFLANMMAQIFYRTEAYAPAIIDEVMTAASSGQLLELQEKYGLASAEAAE